MRNVLIICAILAGAGCSSFSAPAPEEPEGPKRPINAMSTEDRQQLRFIDPENPEKLQKR